MGMLNPVKEPLPLASEERKAQYEREVRLARWRLQRQAQRLLPDEPVAFCMRRLRGSTVDICYSPSHQSAHFRGLMTCGSVWVCPICAAKIAERRHAELEQAIASCIAQGGSVYLATYTVSHHEYDTLPELLKAFLAARIRAKQGRTAQRFQKQFEIIGTVSVREVTWCKQNGWHPHCHELVFFAHEIDAEAYAKAMSQQWEKSAAHEGLSMNAHGFRLDRTYDTIADYMAKFDKMPSKTSWGAAAELTKAHLKRGRGEEHLTPFAILERISQGENELRPLFLEYAQCFKGKHQLVWSPGLRPYPKTPDTRKAKRDEALILLSGAIKPDEMSAQENFSADDLPPSCLDKMGFCTYYLFR